MNQQIQNNTIKIKISILGPQGVGKTRLRKFLCQQQFNDLSTNSIDCSIYSFDGKTVQLWDNPGKYGNRMFLWQQINKVKAFILMSDSSCSYSFQQSKNWYKQLRQIFTIQIIYVIGNKNDRQRTIQKDFVQNFWINQGIQYNQISLVNYGNTRKIMEQIMSEIWYKVKYIQSQNQKKKEGKNIILAKDNPNNMLQKRKRCC